MNQQENPSLTPEQKQARTLLASLPIPSASPQFRERLKREFVAGTVRSPERAAATIPWYRTPGFAPLGIVAAAAILVLAFGLANRGPAWKLYSPVSGGTLIVDGTPVGLDSIESLDPYLKPGSRISIEDPVDVTLICSNQLILQLAPGSEITLPDRPGRWFDRTVRASVLRGRVRVTTGDRFAGARLVVETPEASVEILGTTVSVILESFGTCVCVFEGHVSAAPSGTEPVAVEAGTRRVIFNDGRPPEVIDIRPDEFERLRVLRSL